MCASQAHTIVVFQQVRYFAWDDANNAKLRKERGIGFEDVVFHIERGDLLDVLEHPNPDRYIMRVSASSSSGETTTCSCCRSWRTSTRSS
jgi:hypothetical protein